MICPNTFCLLKLKYILRIPNNICIFKILCSNGNKVSFLLLHKNGVYKDFISLKNL